MISTLKGESGGRNLEESAWRPASENENESQRKIFVRPFEASAHGSLKTQSI